jgi:hypothetical protein
MVVVVVVEERGREQMSQRVGVGVSERDGSWFEGGADEESVFRRFVPVGFESTRLR